MCIHSIACSQKGADLLLFLARVTQILREAAICRLRTSGPMTPADCTEVSSPSPSPPPLACSCAVQHSASSMSSLLNVRYFIACCCSCIILFVTSMGKYSLPTSLTRYCSVAQLNTPGVSQCIQLCIAKCIR